MEIFVFILFFKIIEICSESGILDQLQLKMHTFEVSFQPEAEKTKEIIVFTMVLYFITILGQHTYFWYLHEGLDGV